MPAPVAVDLQTRDQIVLEHLSLVKAIAVRIHETLPVHVELDDLVHAGVLGLIDAASKYDPAKMVAFSSYAKHRIRGAILDSLRQQDWASRDMRRLHKQAEAVARELMSELHRAPNDTEIADRMGIDETRLRQVRIELETQGPLSTSGRGQEQEELPVPELPGREDSHPDTMFAHDEMRSALEEAMQVLPERYRTVVRLYYTDEMTMKEIGKLMGINESRVSQIHKSALLKMSVALQACGIVSPDAFC